ncbi:MAG: TRAP transporter substrate-binding protein DctP [Xanthobacteraceae bacterium]
MRGLKAIAIVLAVFSSSAGGQERPYELKLSHWLAQAHPFHAAIQGWLASVVTASEGTLSGTVYPAAQLGKPVDHYALVRDGAVDLAYVNPGFDRDKFPLFSAGELPFLVEDPEHGSRAFDLWYRRFADVEMQEVKYCFAFVFGLGSLHSKRMISDPSDLKGMTVRSANATLARYMTNFGAIDVRARADDLRNLVASEKAEAITLPWSALFVFKLDTLLPYHLDVPLYVTPFALLMNRASYDALSVQQRRAIDGHCAPEWAERITRPFAADQRAGLARIRSDRAHFIAAPAGPQLQPWQSGAYDAHAEWVARAGGGQAETSLNDLKSIVRQYAVP